MGEKNSAKNHSILSFKTIKICLLWVAILVICLVSLSFLFHRFWKDRIDYGRLDECQLVTDTAVQYLKADQVQADDSRYIDESYLTKLIVTLGWGAAYGDLDAEKIKDMLPDGLFTVEQFAICTEDGYKVLIGDLDESEFHTLSDELYGNSMAQGEWLPDAAPGVNYDSSREEDASWISCRFPNTGYEVLALVSDESYFKLIEDSTGMGIEELTEECKIPENGGLICVDSEAGKVVAVKGSLPASVGDDFEGSPDEEGFMFIAGSKCIAAESAADQYRFIAAIPVGSSRWMRVVSPMVFAVLYTLLLFLTILYAWFLRSDIFQGRSAKNARVSDEIELRKNYHKRVRLMYATMAVMISLIVILISAVSIIDHTRMRMTGLMEDNFDYFAYASEGEAKMQDKENQARLKIAYLIDQVIAEKPSLSEDAALNDLAYSLNAGIFLVDRSGRVISGGAAWSEDYPSYNIADLTSEDADRTALRDVLEGKADGQSSIVEIGDNTFRTSAVQLLDRPGMLMLAIEKSRSSISESVFSNFTMSEGRILFAADMQTHEIVSCSEEKYIGNKLDSFGMTEESMRSGFVGTLLLKSGKYFCVTQENKDILTCMGVNVRYIQNIYFLVILLTVVVGIIVTALCQIILWKLQIDFWTIPQSALTRYIRKMGVVLATKDLTGSGTAAASAEEEDDEDLDGIDNANDRFYEMKDGRISEQIAATGRWTHVFIPFRDRHADEKLEAVIRLLLIAAVACVYIIPGTGHSSGDWKETILFVMSRKWAYGVNLYAIAYSILILLLIMVIAGIVRKVVLLIGSNYGNRGITVARLIDSFISYLAVIGGIAYSLTFFGVDTSTILASVGIVGLGLSLGAKDLVTDIIAGIGIVFEGEFRNGDIVDIGGYRGTVIDIGIRTTKVLADSNVKIFRNSMVSGVINMTQRYSFAEVSIQVARSEPLEKVEKIFQKELPRIRRRIPHAGDDIRLLGVTEMTADYVTLKITLNCDEKHRKKVMRALYREINLMMAKAGIPPKG